MRLQTLLNRLRQQSARPLRDGRFGWWPARSAFEILVGAILTQNTAWVNVEKSIARLREAEALSADAILALSPAELAELIRPSGYYNVKQKRLRALCEWYQQHGPVRRLKRVPTDELRKQLLAVHGVGPETADDILLYALGRPIFVVDAYTRRLLSRIGEVPADIGYEELREKFERELPSDPALYNEYHARIVLHAKHICTAREPNCGACLLRLDCAYAKDRGTMPPVA